MLIHVILFSYLSDDQAAVGDAFKLYWHYYNTDGSGLPGVFLTLFLYVVLMSTGLFTLPRTPHTTLHTHIHTEIHTHVHDTLTSHS